MFSELSGRSGGGLRVKIGHHKIGAWAEIGQNRIRGGWGVKNGRKSSDIIYVRSLSLILPLPFLLCTKIRTNDLVEMSFFSATPMRLRLFFFKCNIPEK